MYNYLLKKASWIAYTRLAPQRGRQLSLNMMGYRTCLYLASAPYDLRAVLVSVGGLRSIRMYFFKTSASDGDHYQEAGHDDG